MTSKIQKRKHKFLPDYATKFKWIVKGNDDYHARCTLCPAEIDLTSTGKPAITRHQDTPKHQAAVRANVSTQSVSNFLTNKSIPTADDDKATAAEGTWAYHTARHHQSFASTDCVSSEGLFRTMFSDSKVAIPRLQLR